MSIDDAGLRSHPSTYPPDSASMRTVLGHFCTGIAVITGHDGTRPYGFACQSITSVSLDPPYVSFCPSHQSTSWPRIRSAGRLCVNVLAIDQLDVCSAFATSGGNKFADIAWEYGSNGAPALRGVLAAIEADFEFEHGAGDHTIVVAHVTALRVHHDRRPLLFYRGGYGGFEGVTVPATGVLIHPRRTIRNQTADDI